MVESNFGCIRNIIRNIAITYNCNRNCSYCYAKGMNVQFPNEMSIENFSKMIEWFKAQNINFLNLIGGEPTTHSKFDEIINILSDNGFSIGLFTNGVFNNESAFSDIIKNYMINYNPPNMYSNREKHILEKNIKALCSTSRNVTLCANINSSNYDPTYIIEECRKYDIKRINCDFCYPNPRGNNKYVVLKKYKPLMKVLLSIVEKCLSNNIEPELIVPIPRCAINTKQKNFLFKYIRRVPSVCTSSQSIYLVNPDLSVYPCPAMQLPHEKTINIMNIKSENEIAEFYKKFIYELHWNKTSFKECNNCLYFKRKTCQGGCLVYKYIQN